jgi:hypothetical protein
MPPDLYAILGIGRDATAEQIKAAYRARAKHTHPDLGGDAEKFGELTAAYDVLSDQERRARYDRDGTIEGQPIDQTLTKALGIIEQMMQQAIGQVGPDGVVYNDVVEKFQIALADSRAQLIRNLDQAKAEVPGLTKFAKRFSVEDGKKNYLADMVNFKVAQRERAIANMEDALKWHDRAAEILEAFSFEADPEPAGLGAWGQGLGSGPFSRVVTFTR